MRNEILKWAEEQSNISGLSSIVYQSVIDKINSIPVPDVEGYLEGKVKVSYNIFDSPVDVVYKSDALAALQSLAANKDDEIGNKQREYDWACDEINKWRKNAEEGWQRAEQLQAEVERLKGELYRYKPLNEPPKQ